MALFGDGIAVLCVVLPSDGYVWQRAVNVKSGMAVSGAVAHSNGRATRGTAAHSRSPVWRRTASVKTCLVWLSGGNAGQSAAEVLRGMAMAMQRGAERSGGEAECRLVSFCDGDAWFGKARRRKGYAKLSAVTLWQCNVRLSQARVRRGVAQLGSAKVKLSRLR